MLLDCLPKSLRGRRLAGYGGAMSMEIDGKPVTSAYIFDDLPPRVSLSCGCCGRDCDQLHEWVYCDSCWYTVVGGDQASDFALVDGVTVRLAHV